MTQSGVATTSSLKMTSYVDINTKILFKIVWMGTCWFHLQWELLCLSVQIYKAWNRYLYNDGARKHQIWWNSISSNLKITS